MPIYYRNRKTGKIEGKFVGCDTLSTVFRNKDLYERLETDRDLPLDVEPVPMPARARVPRPLEEKKARWRRLLHL